VLNHKGHLSVRKAEEICHRLELNRIQTRYFVALVRSKTDKNPSRRQAAWRQARAIRLQQIYATADAKILQRLTWQHFVIRFLVTQPTTRANLEQISQKLNLPNSAVQQLVEDLKSSGLLEETADGYHCTGLLAIEGDAASSVIQSFHRSLLTQASQSLNTVAAEERFFRSSIFTLNREQFYNLQQLIVDFVSSCSDLDESPQAPHDTIYGLGVQLFPLNLPANMLGTQVEP
jgi:uncharacterized protein (TIGR02147 family)